METNLPKKNAIISMKRLVVAIFIMSLVLTGFSIMPALSQIVNPDSDKGVAYAASKKVKVTYKANGGKFTAKKYVKKKSYSKKFKKGKKVGTLPKIKRSGYSFKGWYTKKSGGKKISKNTKVKKNTTYYAHWKKKPAPAKPKTKIIPVTKVSLNQSRWVTANRSGYRTFQLVATVAPSNASDKTIKWTSSNTSVATVSNTGFVNIKVGATASAKITATTHNGKTAVCEIENHSIIAPSILINGKHVPDDIHIEVGESRQVRVSTDPSGFEYVLSWSIDSLDLSNHDGLNIKIDNKGIITGLSAGKDMLRSEDTSSEDNVNWVDVIVHPKLTSISLSQSQITLTKGQNYPIPTPTLNPSNALADSGYSYTSSNNQIATVSNLGVVSTVNAGTADITVTHLKSGKTAVLRVNVNPPSTVEPGVGFDHVRYSSGSGSNTKVSLVVDVSIPSSLTCNQYFIGFYRNKADAQSGANPIDSGTFAKSERFIQTDPISPGLVYVAVQAKNQSANAGGRAIVPMAALHHPRDITMNGMWVTFPFYMIDPFGGGYFINSPSYWWGDTFYTSVPGATGVIETIERVTPFSNGSIFRADGSYQSQGILAQSYGSKQYNGKIKMGYNATSLAGYYWVDDGLSPPPCVYYANDVGGFHYVITLEPYVIDPATNEMIFGEPYISDYKAFDYGQVGLNNSFYLAFPNVY